MMLYSAAEIDQASRKFLKIKDYQRDPHSLGHGVTD